MNKHRHLYIYCEIDSEYIDSAVDKSVVIASSVIYNRVTTGIGIDYNKGLGVNGTPVRV